MVAVFIADVPTVEIVDGMVHTQIGGCEAYWKLATFEEFISEGVVTALEWRDAQRPNVLRKI